MDTKTLLLVSAWLLSGVPGQGQTMPAASQLTTPAGQVKIFEFKTLPTSVQIYTCRATSGEAFAWAGPDPDAVLLGQDKSLIIHHYKGPTWEATDGSIVKGSNARHFRPTREKAVDWLELTAKGSTQRFAKVTHIHRIETEGGLPPDPAACDAAHAGDQIRVPYSAIYEFYGPM